MGERDLNQAFTPGDGRNWNFPSGRSPAGRSHFKKGKTLKAENATIETKVDTVNNDNSSDEKYASILL